MIMFKAVVIICMAVCVRGDVFSIASGNVSQTTNEENHRDVKAVLDQVLEELRYLRDGDQKKTDEIHQLKDAINNLKEEDKKQTNEINYLKDEDKKNKEEINNLKELNEKNMNEINTLKGQITSSQAAAVESSAFMAAIDGGIHNINNEDVIPFDIVVLNLGQNYDPQTSVFTCADSGLYLFSVTLYSSDITYDTLNDRVSGAIMIDGVNMAEIRSVTADPDHAQYHQSAVTAVVECPQGGRVWVECQRDNSRVYGTETTPTSVFTGYAITYYIHP